MDRPAAIEPVLETEHPDLVVVQGDTTTTLAGAVGAFYQQIAVAHVEAGLRTGDMMQPFPEEMNRVLTSRIATWHFAPVHRNPNVLGPAHRILAGLSNVVLLDPLPYTAFVDLMRRCRLIITDSGGIQEEAPSLGKPVLVLREKTERPEALEAGTVKLVGTDVDRIVAEATRLLEDQDEYTRMTRVHNPYDDGHACERVARAREERQPGRLESAGPTG